jgi:protein-arginine kinase activator protein McsA
MSFSTQGITMDKERCDKCGKNEAEFEVSANVEGSRVLNLCENCMMELINKLVANTQEGNYD